jgi:opacity protein-like surface antigen
MFGCVCLVSVLGATARADDIAGAYLGGSIAHARLDTDNARYQDEQEAQASNFGDLVFTKASLHKANPQWWANAGYMLLPYAGLEVSYLHFGALSNVVTGTYTPTGGTAESVGATTLLRSEGPALGAVFRLSLAENVDLNFRLADYYGRTELTNTLTVKTVTATKLSSSDSSLLVGAGAAYTFAGHWSARIDYLRVDKAGNDTKVVKYNAALASVGLTYTF